MVDLMWHWVVDLELFPPSIRGVILGGGGEKWAVLQTGHPVLCSSLDSFSRFEKSFQSQLMHSMLCNGNK